MKWLVFDCPSGIAGDMTLGALVDLGVPLEVLRGALATLPLSGYKLRQTAELRHGIAATQVHVDIEAEHGHGQEHAHAHEHGHQHAHRHEPVQQHTHGHGHRHLPEVLEILRAGQLTPRALAWSVKVFEQLARAEATVHRSTMEEVHFHEVGAIDAIVDIAGSCAGIDWLCTQHGIEGFRVSQIRVGRGVTRTEHGPMPVPPPAVLQLLRGFPLQYTSTEGERVTPTGAALLAAFATPLGDAAVRVEATGYGAGTFRFDDAPNVLRLLLCTPAPVPQRPAAPEREGGAVAGHEAGSVGVVTTTIDDMVPEFFGHVMEKLFAAGALDVYYTPVFMKKGRPATQVTVIAEPAESRRLAEVLLHESSTLGVRITREERLELPRRLATVRTAYGPIQVKVAVRPDGTRRAVPEYESVRGAAAAAGVPLADVYRAALQAEWDSESESSQ